MQIREITNKLTVIGVPLYHGASQPFTYAPYSGIWFSTSKESTMYYAKLSGDGVIYTAYLKPHKTMYIADLNNLPKLPKDIGSVFNTEDVRVIDTSIISSIEYEEISNPSKKIKPKFTNNWLTTHIDTRVFK